jgi:hypothetical protein
MIAAGVDGQGSLELHGPLVDDEITLDRYRHLMPGNEVAAAELLDGHLERANTAARLAQVEMAASSG